MQSLPIIRAFIKHIHECTQHPIKQGYMISPGRKSRLNKRFLKTRIISLALKYFKWGEMKANSSFNLVMFSLHYTSGALQKLEEGSSVSPEWFVSLEWNPAFELFMKME